MDSSTTSSGMIRTIRRNISARRLRREDGQTPTEYLMIVGIMAAVILIAFILFFWDKVKPAAENWSTKASDAVGASKDKKSTVDFSRRILSGFHVRTPGRPAARASARRGQATLESMIMMGFLLLLIFGLMHLVMFAVTRYMVNYAAFAASRAAVVGNSPQTGGRGRHGEPQLVCRRGRRPGGRGQLHRQGRCLRATR